MSAIMTYFFHVGAFQADDNQDLLKISKGEQ